MDRRAGHPHVPISLAVRPKCCLSEWQLRYLMFLGHEIQCEIQIVKVSRLFGDCVYCTTRSKWDPFGNIERLFSHAMSRFWVNWYFSKNLPLLPTISPMQGSTCECGNKDCTCGRRQHYDITCKRCGVSIKIILAEWVLTVPAFALAKNVRPLTNLNFGTSEYIIKGKRNLRIFAPSTNPVARLLNKTSQYNFGYIIFCNVFFV